MESVHESAASTAAASPISRSLAAAGTNLSHATTSKDTNPTLLSRALEEEKSFASTSGSMPPAAISASSSISPNRRSLTTTQSHTHATHSISLPPSESEIDRESASTTTTTRRAVSMVSRKAKAKATAAAAAHVDNANTAAEAAHLNTMLSPRSTVRGLTPLEQKALKYVLKHEAVSISNLM